MKALTRQEHAGFVAEGNKCIEPGCSCQRDAGDRDPVGGPFRQTPIRCTSFETNVLPLDPDLEAAYWDHLERGVGVRLRRCQWKGCRREVASLGPASRFCATHARISRRQTNRDAQRKGRSAVSKLTSKPSDSIGDSEPAPESDR